MRPGSDRTEQARRDDVVERLEELRREVRAHDARVLVPRDLSRDVERATALHDDAVDVPARLREMRRPTNLAGTQAGLGWYITSSGSEEIAWKTGLSGGCNTFVGFSTRRRRGAILLSNFLWRPVDTGTIKLGMKLIEPGFYPRDFGALNSSD